MMDPAKRCTFGSGSKSPEIGEDGVETRRIKRRERARELWRDRVLETPGGLQDLFDEIDADGSGEITYKELLRYFQLQGLTMLVEDGKATFDNLDQDGSNTVDFDEFETWITQDHSKAAIAQREEEKNKAAHQSTMGHSINDPGSFIGAKGGGMSKAGITNAYSSDRYASGKKITFGRKTSKAFGFKSNAEESFNAATLRRNNKRQQLRDTLRGRIFSPDQVEINYYEMLQGMGSDSDDDDDDDGIDDDGAGNSSKGVPFKVFKDFLRKEGLPLMYEDAEMILEEMDTNGDKHISLSELNDFFSRDHSKAGMTNAEKKKFNLEMDAHGHTNWCSGKAMTGHDRFTKDRKTAAAKPKVVLSLEQSLSRDQLRLQALSTDSRVSSNAKTKLAEMKGLVYPLLQEPEQSRYRVCLRPGGDEGGDGFVDGDEGRGRFVDGDEGGDGGGSPARGGASTDSYSKRKAHCYSQTYPIQQSLHQHVDHERYSAFTRHSHHPAVSPRQRRRRWQESLRKGEEEGSAMVRHEGRVRVEVLNKSAERRLILKSRSAGTASRQQEVKSPTPNQVVSPKGRQLQQSSSFSEFFSAREGGTYGHGNYTPYGSAKRSQYTLQPGTANYGTATSGTASPSSVAASSFTLTPEPSPTRAGGASSQYKAKKLSEEMKVFRGRQWVDMASNTKTYMRPHDTLPYNYSDLGKGLGATKGCNGHIVEHNGHTVGAWSCLLDGTDKAAAADERTGKPQEAWERRQREQGRTEEVTFRRRAWGC